jgi:hypothetical protein
MKIPLLTLLLGFAQLTFAQPWLQQYFDGEDTIPSQTIYIQLDTIRDIWQIGEPQKTLFDEASTVPNVIVTDTVNTLPDTVTSSFYFGLKAESFGGGILAIQWVQKLDMEYGFEVGYIEYSKDTGATWYNVFEDPEGYVYNFYGFDEGANVNYSPTGNLGFTGQDTTWANIWLCMDYSFWSGADSVIFKYTIQTDTETYGSEGWMLDNFHVYETWFHTITELSSENAFTAFPTATAGPLTVVYNRSKEPTTISSVELIDLKGRVVEKFYPENPNFELDLSRHYNGHYTLKIITETGFDTCPIVIER